MYSCVWRREESLLREASMVPKGIRNYVNMHKSAEEEEDQNLMPINLCGGRVFESDITSADVRE